MAKSKKPPQQKPRGFVIIGGEKIQIGKLKKGYTSGLATPRQFSDRLKELRENAKTIDIKPESSKNEED